MSSQALECRTKKMAQWELAALSEDQRSIPMSDTWQPPNSSSRGFNNLFWTYTGTCMHPFTHTHTHPSSVVIWIRRLPKPQIFECLIWSWWNCLEIIRGMVFIGGGVSLGVGFEVSEVCTIPTEHSMLCLRDRCKLSTTAPALCKPACCHTPLHDVYALTFWNHKHSC